MLKTRSALLALGFGLMMAPDMATAGDTLVAAQGIVGIGHPGGYGYARLYGHPFDDGHDDPFGYGEYAQYGPWAYRNDGECFALRRVRTARGWRQVLVSLCD